MSEHRIPAKPAHRLRIGSLLAGVVALAMPVAVPTAAHATYYPNCDAARAAGVAPIYRGQDGYASHLDRDGDGIACETGGSSGGGSTGGGSYTGPYWTISLAITSARRLSGGGVEVAGTISCYDDVLRSSCSSTGREVQVGVLSGGALTSTVRAWTIGDTFQADFGSSYPSGATFQARYPGDRFSDPASSSPYVLAAAAAADRPSPARTLAPAPTPTTAPAPGRSTARAKTRTTVRAKPVARRGKLRVDVGPDAGPKRRFAVQVRTRAGWRKIGPVRTARGWRHVKTVNLGRGVYRVKVLARPGYTRATSRAVVLAR